MKPFLQSNRKLVLVTNLILGIFLWLLDSSDLSLRGTEWDIVFPPLIFVIALITILTMPNDQSRSISRLAYLPSFLGGGMHVLIGLIMIFPPFTLAFLFGLDEFKNEVQIQQISSPSNTKIAEVYFRPVGAYSGGSGRLYVKVVNKSVPFVERDILYLRVSHADENTENYLKWIDNDTLFISEIAENISVGGIKFETPYAIAVPINIGRFLIFMFS